ncbi:tyrosyl-DNA phosphodiesterase I [Gorgonomyces haynaldii]|nr:tyrosyl-DNA phosphodiesterase I [Gorgonomyces haynaldii]
MDEVIVISDDEGPQKRIKRKHLDPSQPIYDGFVGKTSEITIQELMQQPEKAFMSAFVLDDDWLEEILDWKKLKFPLWIARPKPDDIDASYWQVAPKLCFIFPKMRGFGAMHIKFMIFFFKDRVRVIITSANLIPMDWSLMENAYFVQDFGLGSSETQFQSRLSALLQDMGFPNNHIDSLRNYDFFTHLGHLVISQPGSWKQDKGFDMMQRIVSKMDVQVDRIVYQCSSLGKMSQEWMSDMILAFSGGKTLDLSQMHILYPSKETIEASALGPELGGGHFFMNPSYRNELYDQLLYDIHATKRGGLMHTKLILTCPKPWTYVTTLDQEADGYLYCGSHNFTASAWGKRTKNGRITINNWELGIILKTGQDGIPFELPFEFPSTRNTNPWS